MDAGAEGFVRYKLRKSDHFFLLDLVVDDVAGGKLLLYIVYGYAHLYHEHHEVIRQIRKLLHGFALVASLASDDNFRGFLADLLENLIDALVEEIGGVRAFGALFHSSLH